VVHHPDYLSVSHTCSFNICAAHRSFMIAGTLATLPDVFL